MARDDHTGGAQPALRLSRRLPAPREKVFAALSRAEALRRWMCPQGFTCTA
ncbi:MAG: SRPBCC domain-containing protein, partial [Proteobacteria bacterium]|nr:SRPBCC domain-containing protein [Pseudomonadota bacterium]